MSTDSEIIERPTMRMEEVQRYLSVSRSAIYSLRADPTSGFPEPLKLMARVALWRKADLDAWVASAATRAEA